MILTFIEQVGNTLPRSAQITIAAALQAKKVQGHQRAIGVVLGASGAAEVAKEAAEYGLDEVLYVEDPALEQYLAVPFAEALLQVCKEVSPKLVLAAASSIGKDLLPRVAQGLQAGQASDCIEFLSTGFRRPMYAGDVIADVEVATATAVATIRISAFDAAQKTAATAPVRAVPVSVSSSASQRFVSFDTTKSERPELAEAEVVVSGGRALKSAENFDKLIAPLADKLGAAIGASRAAVDSGYAPNDWQVGQTGKIVAPKLYIAVGISGAIQHMAGMKDSKVIVAINSDPEAPIFEIADYGLVGDLYSLLPELIEKLPG